MKQKVESYIKETENKQTVDKELSAVESIEELVEAVEVQLAIIHRLLGGKRIVNLDEAIAYYESLIKKYKKP